MSKFGISQNFRNASLLGRFARTDQINKNAKDVKDAKNVSSSSSSVEKPERESAAKLTAVTSRYVTRSADHH